jgi:hypothetical protein
LDPQLLGCQANLQGFTVHLAQLFAQLLQRRPALIDVFAAAGERPPLFVQLSQGTMMLGSHALALGPDLVLELAAIGEQLLTEPVHLRLGLVNVGFGLLELSLSGVQHLGRLSDLFFPAEQLGTRLTRLGEQFSGLELCFPAAPPHAAKQ